MSDSVTIWHNPRCSKSRQTMALLEEKGVAPDVVEYLKTPPDIAEIKAVLGKLGVPARKLMRTKESVYKELDLKRFDDGAEELVEAMAANPVLIERPLVLKAGKAALGRPPEAVLDIL